jgi:hypothetical protein
MSNDEFRQSKTKHTHLWVKVRQYSFRVKAGHPAIVGGFKKKNFRSYVQMPYEIFMISEHLLEEKRKTPL